MGLLWASQVASKCTDGVGFCHSNWSSLVKHKSQSWFLQDLASLLWLWHHDYFPPIYFTIVPEHCSNSCVENSHAQKLFEQEWKLTIGFSVGKPKKGWIVSIGRLCCCLPCASCPTFMFVWTFIVSLGCVCVCLGLAAWHELWFPHCQCVCVCFECVWCNASRVCGCLTWTVTSPLPVCVCVCVCVSVFASCLTWTVTSLLPVLCVSVFV